MPKVDERKKDYDVLGLEGVANEVEIKKAFARLALKYHPDLHSASKINGQENHLQCKTKFQEVCKAYKRIMSEDPCSISDWNMDKSDEIFFSLLGELLQNSTRAGELYTLLSSQANSRSQFQNDNEYRCKEDAMEDDDEESELNKLVDILKNRLQNGKSVPAGLTQEKLTRLKDDFIKQKEENKRIEQQNNHTPSKKAKSISAIPIAKPKPKNKKQLQADQRRRELEMAKIAEELEEKKRKEEEKEQIRKEQELERKRLLEEEARKMDDDKKKQINETKKKKDREEKEKELRSQKEKEKNDRLKKSQEEEQRKKEEEKRRKAEEKATKQKTLRENKEKGEREKQEEQKQQNTKTKSRSQQFQQYQQQQQKYPREVPPRFLRQQQIKQLTPRSGKEQDSLSYNNEHTQYSREDTRWTAIVPDTTLNEHISSAEDWHLDSNSSTKTKSSSIVQRSSNHTWGGVPASEDWDLDISNQTRCSVASEANNKELSSSTSNVVKSLFGPSDPPLPSMQSDTNGDTSWGVSLTGSTWDSGNVAVKRWGSNISSNTPSRKSSVDENLSRPSIANGHHEPTLLSSQMKSANSQNVSKAIPLNSFSNRSKFNHLDSMTTGTPGITPWAGLDDFDGGPPPVDLNFPYKTDNVYTGGAKPKTTSTDLRSYNSYQSNNSDKARSQNTCDNKIDDSIEKHVNVPTLDNKVDSNLKVTGWLQNTASSEDWDEEEKEHTDSDGWTTVSLKTKKPTGGSQVSSAPGTPSKSDGSNNACTNKALKQLLDMGFKREHAEKALRDNNGIIESAVSDLLLKRDSTESGEPSAPFEQKPSVIASGAPSSTASSTTIISTSQPQKLNRKQRRKLQQIQMAEQVKEAIPSSNSSAAIDIPQTQSTPHTESTSQTSTSDTSPKPSSLHGDGLLPTPPASQRLIQPANAEKTPGVPIDKVISRPIGSKTPGSDISIQKAINRNVVVQPTVVGSQLSTSDVSSNSLPHPPIGTRPTPLAPIQPPAPIQQPNAFSQGQTTANGKDAVGNLSNTVLQPPVNPVLLAQMHLQKLGLEDAPPVTSFNTPPVPSQSVTNSMIERYLQQIAQATPEVQTTSSVSASMHLSGLLPQAPIPASSLSEGPMKSKLLQWTQNGSTGTSEPTTPPSEDSKSNLPHNIDPVSAKWGVIAAPRLSPTPAEFKPGVPWRSRGEADDEKESDEDGSRKSSPRESSTILPDVSKSQSVRPAHVTPEVKPAVHSDQTLSLQSITQQHVRSTLNDDSSMIVRPPPGLLLADEMKSLIPQRNDSMCWLVLKGISSAADPSSVRLMCHQFGTVLHFRAIGSAVYVCYETPQQAKNACLQLSGQVIFNTQILADVVNEEACMKALQEVHTPPPPPQSLQMNNHVSQQQPIPTGYQNMPSLGALWTTPAALSPNVQQPLFQRTYPIAYGAPPTTIGMNGSFNHWGLPAQAVIPNSSHLWGPAPLPQQPSNIYQTYPSWMGTKPEVQMQSNIFSPGMDRCIPSELFNVTEQGS